MNHGHGTRVSDPRAVNPGHVTRVSDPRAVNHGHVTRAWSGHCSGAELIKDRQRVTGGKWHLVCRLVVADNNFGGVSSL